MDSDNRFGVVFFVTLIVAAVCWALVGHARGDDFTDLTRRLEAQNAAKKTPPKADSFSRSNKAGGDYTTPYQGNKVCDCGCIETGRCGCKNCCSPTKVRDVEAPDVAPRAMTADDPLIMASDGRLYPRSAWGPSLPPRASWEPLRGSVGGGINPIPTMQGYYAPVFGGSFSCGRGG